MLSKTKVNIYIVFTLCSTDVMMLRQIMATQCAGRVLHALIASCNKGHKGAAAVAYLKLLFRHLFNDTEKRRGLA
jgi:hypothetical protein